MKSIVRTIILVAASVFAAISCQKEAAVSETQNSVKAGETIQVNINASLGDLVAADGTKATAESVVRLKWAEGDKVQAYCGANKIGTDLIVTPSANGLFASLTGTITAPETNEIITFVYSNGCTANGLTFDFSNQGTDIPFVAYATLNYEGEAGLSEKMVEFKFATLVMKIAATNLGGGAISNATISGINTKVTLTLSASGDPTIGGNTDGNIETTNIAAPSDGTRAIITVGLVPDTSTGRNITVTQTGYTNKGVITKTTIESNKSYTTPTSLFTCGTLGTGTGAHDYVLIAGTKWATRNIGATGDTGTDSYGTYFAWGATVKAYSAVDYTKTTGAFTFLDSNPYGDIYKNTWDPSAGFSWNNTPFTDGVYSDSNKKVFTKYVPENKKSDYGKSGTFFDERITLELANDAANKNWGGTWRMPTSAEFLALKKATFWKWDDTDKGYYVYAPQSGDAGKKNSDSGVTGTYNKSAALLFFPAAGSGTGTRLDNAGSYGRYWSSSLRTSSPNYAYDLYFNSGNVSPQDYSNRYFGFSVRPVSD